MSILEIKYDTGHVQNALELMRHRCADLTPAMAVIGNQVVGSVIENFETGRSPEGQPWKPSTRARKHGGQTLVDSAALKNSIGMEPSSNRVVIYASREYARIHQEGGVIKIGARQQTLNFRTYKSGPRRGRTLFAKAGKASHSILANVGAHQITMPARPYLGVKLRDWQMINGTLLRRIINGQS